MALDPSIFFRGAELQANNAARTQATIGNFFDKLSATKQKQLDLEKAKETDYEGSAYRVIMAQKAGVEPDPKDLIRAQAWDVMNTSQNAINPATGEAFPKNTSIFGNLQASPGPNYQGSYAPPVMGPMPQGTSPGMQLDVGPFGNVNDDIGLMPPVGDNYAEVAGMTPAMRDSARDLPAPGNPRQAQSNYETKLAIAKDQALEENKVNAAMEGETRKLAKMEIDTLPALNDMLKFNQGTLDIPYAGTGPVQAGAMALSPEAATNMDLLKQARLELAAPLAKQLGVNPTDKDFKATLERIVDVNSTKASREAQIRQLINKIERKRDLEGRGFKTTQERTDKPKSSAVSYEDYFK